MKDYKKTILGSIVLFFLGTSCCWLTSLAIWLGGLSFLGILITWIEEMQTLLIAAGVVLALLSAYLFWQKQRKK